MGAPDDRPSTSSSTSTVSSASTTSLVFERIAEREASEKYAPRVETNDDELLSDDPLKETDSPSDLETGAFLPRSNTARHAPRPMDKRLRRALYVLATLLVASWGAGLFFFVTDRAGKSSPGAAVPTRHPLPVDPSTQITLEQLQTGFWSPKLSSISWINGPNGEDGLLLNRGVSGKDYLVVEDVTAVEGTEEDAINKPKPMPRAEVQSVVKTLMAKAMFNYGGADHTASRTWPSPDHKKVLIATDTKSVWRHSFTAIYWVLDVATQNVEPLDLLDASARVQLASWSPQSDAIIYTKNNNLFLRHVMDDQSSANKKPHGPTQITKDGGENYFYGIPDWVYEEEVFSGNSATWWSADGKYVAFLRTNESGVIEFPVDYYIQRRPGTTPPPEGYPDTLKIKYPKAGAPNPVVDLQFYDVAKGDVFSVDIADDFKGDDRLITNVLWAGDKVVVKETNRVSDIMHVVLIDVPSRTGKNTRTVDVTAIDNGWFEISQTKYVPADPANGRPDDGYIDTVIHDDGDHLGYFTPLDASEPRMLTSGPWEVVDAPSAVDLANNLVYFVSTKESSIQRHIYSVKLDGTDLKAVTNTSSEGYYDMSFSAGAGYTLVTYKGPQIPWQMVQSSPANPSKYERVVESNPWLADKAAKYALPELVYGKLKLTDGTQLNYVERRPPNFDPSQKYPVLFFQYSGPGSQQVDKTFKINWQSYVASTLGYLVVTVDGRGTGYIGRKARVVVRGHLGRYESRDQIFAGKHWASLPYVDADRLAIWGWSFGGFNTLKTLETDGGNTFKYGMAVAPVTDWRFYDSVYTERYMLLPSTNKDGYLETAISNVTALAANERFLIMHGTGDDNVHFQNTLSLLDKLDQAAVVNYDVHVFPDSNHGIYFHNANTVVYEKLTQWLINAFNGEWARLKEVEPKEMGGYVGA